MKVEVTAPNGNVYKYDKARPRVTSWGKLVIIVITGEGVTYREKEVYYHPGSWESVRCIADKEESNHEQG